MVLFPSSEICHRTRWPIIATKSNLLILLNTLTTKETKQNMKIFKSSVFLAAVLCAVKAQNGEDLPVDSIEANDVVDPDANDDEVNVCYCYCCCCFT